MKIKDFVGSDLRYDTQKISADAELNQEVQQLLIYLGLLNLPLEPTFGDRAIAALTRFQQRTDCDEPGFLGSQTAAKLVEASESGTRAPVEGIRMKVLETTALKLRPLATSVLEDNEKLTIRVGEPDIELIGFLLERKHIQITLATPRQGSVVWYVFGEHVKVYGGQELVLPPPPPDENPAIPPTPSKPPQVKLAVPYKSQNDNSEHPDGSCNVTSISMCLEFLKIPRKKTSGQFEDELYNYMLQNGLNRHFGEDLAIVVEDYGAKDDFTRHANVEDVKSWLTAGNPAVTHGYFTTFGHIIVLVGYDEKGFIVHDPNGEWFSWGYDKNVPGSSNEKGKFQHYSYKLIEDTCQTDNQFWVHFISK